MAFKIFGISSSIRLIIDQLQLIVALWLDGDDLRTLPLLDRKGTLRRVVPFTPAALCMGWRARGISKESSRSTEQAHYRTSRPTLGEDQKPRVHAVGRMSGTLRGIAFLKKSLSASAVGC